MNSPLRLTLLLALALACFPRLAPAAGPLPEDEKKQGFIALQDGTGFTGWEQKGNWVIEDGTFYRKGKGGDLTCSTPVPDDFELRFAWKVSKGCNSGVYYRPGQYEYQVLDNQNSPYGENPRQAAASLFFCMAPNKDNTRPLGEWNEGRIVCKGTVIQHWLNGETVLDFDYTDPRWSSQVELLRIRGANLAARGGSIRLQDHGADVWYRNLRLRALPKDEALVRINFEPMPIPEAALKKEQERVEGMLKQSKSKESTKPQPSASKPAMPVKLIFDTDMHTDCDDAGAMAVLHALADKGECEILAVMCSTRDPWAGPAIDVFNTYYGRPDLPIGTVKDVGVLRSSKYTQGVAQRFPHRLKTTADAEEAVELYRRVLEKQPDQSVVIVTVGYLTNIANLLKAPAAGSRVSGKDLVQQKVKQWVCMGGNFIGRPAKDDLKLGNVNFTYDAPASLYSIQHWPGDLVFAGREVCSVPSGVKVGASLATTPETNPVRVAYELYFDGKAKDRHVADLVSVLYAVRGLTGLWDVESQGYMDLQPDMKFEWKTDRDSRQSYLLKKRDAKGKPNDRDVEKVLEALLLQPPRTAAK